MLRPRIIPCLLIRNGGLVKTVNFGAPKYVGDPLNAVRIFNEKEVDEIVVLDIDATARGGEPNYALIKNLAAECRMPLCYGGGVRNVEQFQRLVSLGVEKVAVSTAALENPALVKEAASKVGSQSVTAILDIKKSGLLGGYKIFIRNGSKNTGRSVVDVVRELDQLGAGEIVINSIDRDGTMKGYDFDLIAQVRKETDRPITILGGAGSLQDVAKLIQKFGIIGAAAGSLFVFKGVYRAVLINYPNRAEKDALILSALGGSSSIAR